MRKGLVWDTDSILNTIIYNDYKQHIKTNTFKMNVALLVSTEVAFLHIIRIHIFMQYWNTYILIKLEFSQWKSELSYISLKPSK